MAQLPDEADRLHEEAPGGPLSSERARNITRGFLSVCLRGTKRSGENVLLVVSELIANAVRHAGGATDFQLRRAGNHVVVTVSDASPYPPLEEAPTGSPCRGLGWPLVRRLASAVRVDTHAHGKTIRAVVPLD